MRPIHFLIIFVVLSFSLLAQCIIIIIIIILLNILHRYPFPSKPINDQCSPTYRKQSIDLQTKLTSFYMMGNIGR